MNALGNFTVRPWNTVIKHIDFLSCTHQRTLHFIFVKKSWKHTIQGCLGDTCFLRKTGFEVKLHGIFFSGVGACLKNKQTSRLCPDRYMSFCTSSLSLKNTPEGGRVSKAEFFGTWRTPRLVIIAALLPCVNKNAYHL